MSEPTHDPLHPDPERLGAFVEGTLDEDGRSEVTTHLSACNECLDLVAGAAHWRRQHDAEVAKPRTRSRPLLWLTAAAVAGGIVGTVAIREALRDAPRAPLASLVAAAPREYRFVEPRLSGFPWAPIQVFRENTPTFATDDPAYLRLAGAAGQALETALADESSGEAAHAAGLGQILLRRPEAATKWLTRTTSIEPGNARAWSDLAAAQLTRAIQEGRPSDLPAALASVDRAIELEPALAEALFNRALILEKLGLPEDAAEAWRAFLAVDSVSPWAREARDHLNRLTPPASGHFRDRVDQIEQAAAVGSEDAVRSLVDQHRQEARLWFEVEGLGRWAAAVAAGDAKLEQWNLVAVASVASALLHLNGESLLADAVEAIRKANPERYAALAAAHARYREGRLLYQAHQLPAAQKELNAAAAALERNGSPMALLARYYAATALFDQSRVSDALDLLRTIEPAISTSALKAQVLTQIGLCEAYAGRWEAAIGALLDARKRFEALGETAFAGSVDSKIAEVYEFLGQRDTAWSHRISAFESLTVKPMHDRLIAAIGGAARAELHAGRTEAALALLDLEIGRASGSSNPLALADGLRRRAAVHHRRDDPESAWSDVREARAVMMRASESELRARLEVETSLVEANLMRATKPADAVVVYTRAIEYFRQAGHLVFIPQALLERARANRLRGDPEGAMHDLAGGIDELESQRRAAQAAHSRATLFDQQSELFEEFVDLALERGDVTAALAQADRAHGRLLLDEIENGHAIVGGDLTEHVRRNLGNTQALVETMLIPDGVALIAITSREARAVRVRVNRVHLESAIELLRSALVRREADQVIRNAAGAIHRLLIEPLQDHLAGVDQIVFVGDRVLEAVPWAALYSSHRDRWLVEDHSVTVAPSAAVWLTQSQQLRSGRRTDRLLVVADRGGQGREPLTWTTTEAKMVASLYPEHRLLLDGEATAERFVVEAPRFDVIHFAGHAEERRGGGALIFNGSGQPVELSASEIATLRLAGTRLVLLAACGTARAEHSGLEGMPSLARGFLAAGVPSVIATLWPIDDAEASALVAGIHRSLREGNDVAGALRDAQLQMLRADMRAWRHPGAWAGVEVLGAS